MDDPTRFNLYVPQRVHKLICNIYDKPYKSKSKRFPQATFLLSMSMPILILPTEHIRQHIKVHEEQNKKSPTDNHACKMKRVFDEKVCNKEFFECLWQYASCEQKNLSNTIKKLDLKEAKKNAMKLTTCRFLSILRNAMAHGRVRYLDDEGRSSPGAIVHGFAFVSKNPSEGRNRRHILRVGIDDYREFLKKWTTWIEKESNGGLLTKCASLES